MEGAISEAATEWLDKRFVQDVLSNDGDKCVVVDSVDVKMAVGKGDNYASLLYRVSVAYHVTDAAGEERQKKTSLIVKCMPAGEIMKKFITEAEIFPREKKMYSQTLPAMYSILDSAFEPGSIRMASRILECDREDTIVLEDLRESGFEMVDRREGLDLEHSLVVIKKLAVFHAASVALHARDPEQVESYEEFFYNEAQRDKMEKLMPVTYTTLADIVEGWGKEYLVYAEKLRAFGKVVTDQLIHVMKPKNNLNVLTHGDCWVNNVLFKYDPTSGNPVDIRFVDFQMSRYVPAATDLQYLIYSSVRGEVREQHLEQLLGQYVSELNKTLAALGLEDASSSLEQMRKEFDAYSVYGLVATCNILCAVLADPVDAFQLDDKALEKVEEGDVSFLERTLKGRRYKAALQKLLPHFVEKGAL